MAESASLVICIELTVPGITAEGVEREVTMPIERQLSGVAGVRRITSSSGEGLSTVEISFETTPGPQDKSAVTQAVEKARAQMAVATELRRIAIQACVLQLP
ncbi:efflux RND transporter permease subunit [Roseateles oligotrophus]|uniref:efflux RND transporter permease subunit n=1 Tax=Roseateles oligotrophus TaxID=1769250 RepID=UPI0037CA7A6A